MYTSCPLTPSTNIPQLTNRLHTQVKKTEEGKPARCFNPPPISASFICLRGPACVANHSQEVQAQRIRLDSTTPHSHLLLNEEASTVFFATAQISYRPTGLPRRLRFHSKVCARARFLSLSSVEASREVLSRRK